MGSIQIRYASSDDDVIAIHRFLLVVAAPTLPGPIDPKASIEEIWRIAREDVAVIATEGDAMVGTMGLAVMREWWAPDIRFLGNRWLFAIPGSGAWRPMMREAKAIAKASEMECKIASETRGKLIILNKSKVRGQFNVLRQQSANPDANVHTAQVATNGRTG